MSSSMADWSPYDRAIAAEQRRCKRLGLVFRQPSTYWRNDRYSIGELFEIGNCNGAIATYWVSPTGKVIRKHDGGIETN